MLKPIVEKNESAKGMFGIVTVDSLKNLYEKEQVPLNNFKKTVLSVSIYDDEKILFAGGSEITEELIKDLEDRDIKHVTISSKSDYLKAVETGEMDKVYNIPFNSPGNGVSLEEIRKNFYAISANAVTERGFDPKLVEKIMDQFVGASENIMLFGNVLNEIRLLSNFSDYTYVHSLEVMITSLLLAKKLEEEGKINPLSPKEVLSLAIGSFFHDLGKMKFRSLVESNRQLDQEERNTINKHVQLGVIFAKAYLFPIFENRFKDMVDIDVIEQIIGGHHLRYDGVNDPQNRKNCYFYLREALGDSENQKENIKDSQDYYLADGTQGSEHNEKGKIFSKNVSPMVWIVGLADAINAMLQERPYQSPKHQTAVMDIVLKESGKQFNPDMADTAVKIIVPYPENSIVVLHNGMMGMVREYDTDTHSLEFTVVGSMTESGKEIIVKDKSNKVVEKWNTIGETFSAPVSEVAYGTRTLQEVIDVGLKGYLKQISNKSQDVDARLFKDLRDEYLLISERRPIQLLGKNEERSIFEVYAESVIDFKNARDFVLKMESETAKRKQENLDKIISKTADIYNMFKQNCIEEEIRRQQTDELEETEKNKKSPENQKVNKSGEIEEIEEENYLNYGPTIEGGIDMFGPRR